MPEPSRPLRRFLLMRLIYLVVVLLLALLLWLLVPADVKKTIYETYIHPPGP